MNPLCPAACVDFTLVEVKEAACKIEYRKVNIRCIAFYKCDVVLPEPMTAQALEDLYEAGDIVFSNELVNVSVGEPVYEERKLSDCSPAYQELVERQISFEDRIKVTKTTTTGGEDPVTTTNHFLDYDFWQDKLDHQLQLNYAFVMCNGDLVPNVDADGRGIPATFQMHINYETLQRGGAIEIKAGTLTFMGDPLSMKYKPAINLNSVTALDGKW